MPKKVEESSEFDLINWERQDSPYYDENHKKFREICRNFVTKEVIPNIDKWSKNGDIPSEFYKKMYDAGLYAKWYPKFYGGTPYISLQHALDPFYTIILNEEFAKAGSAGLIATTWIHFLVVTPILLHGNNEQKEIMKSIIKADKFASLAVSEPTAGSDVKNLKTTAKKIIGLDGNNDYYLINGEKYWITGGMKADYFLTACQTYDELNNNLGISLFLIPRQSGVTTTRLALQGHDCSATAYVIFNNIKIHKNMLVGKTKQGFKQTMQNFNNERLGIICVAVGLSRVCIEESIHYARNRKTFGKLLIEHQVIRHKLGEMARMALSTHSYLENVCYRMRVKPFSTDPLLIRDVALLKVQATRTLEYCAREASQIFGGRSYVRGGRAGKIERIYRDVRALAIYGGSEEIMIRLACSQTKLSKL